MFLWKLRKNSSNQNKKKTRQIKIPFATTTSAAGTLHLIIHHHLLHHMDLHHTQDFHHIVGAKIKKKLRQSKNFKM